MDDSVPCHSRTLCRWGLASVWPVTLRRQIGTMTIVAPSQCGCRPNDRSRHLWPPAGPTGTARRAASAARVCSGTFARPPHSRTPRAAWAVSPDVACNRIAHKWPRTSGCRPCDVDRSRWAERCRRFRGWIASWSSAAWHRLTDIGSPIWKCDNVRGSVQMIAAIISRDPCDWDVWLTVRRPALAAPLGVRTVLALAAAYSAAPLMYSSTYRCLTICYRLNWRPSPCSRCRLSMTDYTWPPGGMGCGTVKLAQDWIRGVMNLHGKIVCIFVNVVDWIILATRFWVNLCKPL